MKSQIASGEKDWGVKQTVGHGLDQPADPVRQMRMGSHRDAILLLINQLVSACLGGQILTV